jgi:cytochrome b involved in lipid metabolism
MKKTVTAVALALALSIVVAPGSSAAVKAGAACKKAGLTSVASGYKYTCVKKSGKLVWVKGAAVKASAKPSVSASAAAAGYTMEKVKANASATSCWSVIKGNVYNLTSWINQHPGGSSSIKSLCGVDGSVAFAAQHQGQSKPESRLSGFLLGPLTK